MERAPLTWPMVSAAGEGGPTELGLHGEEGWEFTLLPRHKPCLKGAPRAALGQPLPSLLGCHMGCRGRKRGAVQLGWSKLVRRKLLSRSQDLDALPTHHTAPVLQGPRAGGFQGISSGLGPGERVLQMCLQGGPTPT